MLYVDLTWMKSKYGGYNHYVRQIIKNYKDDKRIKFIISTNNKHLFSEVKPENSLIIKTEIKSSFRIINSLYYYYYRIFKLGVLQKKTKSPFLYPADPGHLIKYAKVIFIKHDICRHEFPFLFSSRFSMQNLFWNNYSNYVTRKADIVGTVSFSEKSRISKKINIKKEKLFVTTNYVVPKTKVINRLKRKRFLFIGALVKRKNVKALLEIANFIDKNKLDYEVLIVGRKTPYWNKLAKNISYHCITYKNNISDKEKELYFDNSIFLFPSLCEGFGIPVLESINNCAPVICNRLPIMEEILGELGLYIDFLKENFIDNLFKKINQLDKNYFDYFDNHRNKILSRFSEKIFKNQFNNIIESL